MLFVKNHRFIIYLTLIIAIGTLLITEPSIAATYTAGFSGTYPTIQAAINAASGETSEPNDVKVQQGAYSENLYISALSDIGTMNITGGWNSTFTVRDTDYTLTTIDGGETDCVVYIRVQNGGTADLTLDGFTLQNGGNITTGAGILMSVYNDSQITINNNRILNNVASSQYGTAGGGIYAYFDDTGILSLSITNNLIKGNSITCSEGSVSGAGIEFSFHEDAVFNVTGNIIEDNTSTNSPYQAAGIGVYIWKNGSGSCNFSNNIIRNNTANGTGSRFGIAGQVAVADSSTLTMRRNQWLNNSNNGGSSGNDLNIYASGTSTLTVTDSLIAGAVDDGLFYSAATSTSTIRMTNLTIIDNSDIGLNKSSTSPGTTSLYNSILYNNGTNYDTLPGDNDNNLIGTDPEFVDSANYNYRLRPGSPAINAGTNSPSGGLGSLDLDGRERISKSTVDIGAYEFSPSTNAGVLFMLLN